MTRLLNDAVLHADRNDVPIGAGDGHRDVGRSGLVSRGGMVVNRGVTRLRVDLAFDGAAGGGAGGVLIDHRDGVVRRQRKDPVVGLWGAGRGKTGPVLQERVRGGQAVQNHRLRRRIGHRAGIAVGQHDAAVGIGQGGFLVT